MPKEKLFSITKKDFDIQTFKAGGPGGQHQNKTDSGVRIIHKETGISAESRSEKSQTQNKRIALRRLVNNPKFKAWLHRRVHEITSGKSVAQRVDEAMRESNLKVEVRGEQGQWVEFE